VLKVNKANMQCAIYEETTKLQLKTVREDWKTCNKFTKVLLDSDNVSKDYSYGMVGVLLKQLISEEFKNSKKETLIVIKDIPGEQTNLHCKLCL
jgi:hypothetical protein